MNVMHRCTIKLTFPIFIQNESMEQWSTFRKLCRLVQQRLSDGANAVEHHCISEDASEKHDALIKNCNIYRSLQGKQVSRLFHFRLMQVYANHLCDCSPYT